LKVGAGAGAETKSFGSPTLEKSKLGQNRGTTDTTRVKKWGKYHFRGEIIFGLKIQDHTVLNSNEFKRESLCKRRVETGLKKITSSQAVPL
jgi:hypothetical protein